MPNQKIKIETVKRGIAKSNAVIISRTPETRIVFESLLHSGGVNCSLVKYKKAKKLEWENLKKDEFKTHALNLMEKVEIHLKTEELKKLVEEILSREEIIKDGIKSGTKEYITVEKEKIVLVNDTNKREVINQLLTKGYSDDFWEMLTTDAPDLADKLAAGRIQTHRKNIVELLEERLKNTFPETSGKNSWQSWIYSNSWLFGANYTEPIDRQRLNLNGIMPDYLFPTIDGFVDVLEIKLPEDPVLIEDRNHKGSWKWSSEANKAIGQVVNYLSEIDRLRREIEAHIEVEYEKKLIMLKPRAYILLGNSETWGNQKKEGLRKLNHSLHGIEIITYQQLLNRGQSFIVNPIPGTLKTRSLEENICF